MRLLEDRETALAAHGKAHGTAGRIGVAGTQRARNIVIARRRPSRHTIVAPARKSMAGVRHSLARLATVATIQPSTNRQRSV